MPDVMLSFTFNLIFMKKQINKNGYRISYSLWEDETALCFDWTFWILNWDYYDEFDKCKDLDEAKEVFSRERKEWNESDWSEFNE